MLNSLLVLLFCSYSTKYVFCTEKQAVTMIKMVCMRFSFHTFRGTKNTQKVAPFLSIAEYVPRCFCDGSSPRAETAIFYRKNRSRAPACQICFKFPALGIPRPIPKSHVWMMYGTVLSVRTTTVVLCRNPFWLMRRFVSWSLWCTSVVECHLLDDMSNDFWW